MSRSRNSRKGMKHHRKGGRHATCSEGSGCDYCLSNFTIAARRQVPAKDTP